MSILKEKQLLVLGEGVDLFTHEVPASLAGKRLAESGIGARTGLNVVGVRTRLAGDVILEPGHELVMIGSDVQDAAFVEAFV